MRIRHIVIGLVVTVHALTFLVYPRIGWTTETAVTTFSLEAGAATYSSVPAMQFEWDTGVATRVPSGLVCDARTDRPLLPMIRALFKRSAYRESLGILTYDHGDEHVLGVSLVWAELAIGLILYARRR